MPTAGPDSSTATTNTHSGQTVRDVVIRLAGNSQDGIQAIGGFLARLAGRIEARAGIGDPIWPDRLASR